jgi:hypothetical protein
VNTRHDELDETIMTLDEKIAINRRKWALYRRAERVLRATRLRVFDLEDAGFGWKAERMIANCRRILAPRWAAERRHS